MVLSKYRRLDPFLECIIAKHLNFRQSKTEVKILRGLVLDMVNKIVKAASHSGVRWSGKRVIPVGSMAEETRIGRPNEFDFMVVVDTCDGDDIKSVFSGERGTFIKLKRDCRREAKPFQYRNNCHCKRKNRCKCDDLAYMDKGIIKSTENAIKIALTDMRRDRSSCSKQSFPGTLRLVDSSTYNHGPAIQFNLLWTTQGTGGSPKSMEISIDLVPVIEFEINAYFRHRLDVYDPDFYDELKETGTVHVTPPISNANDDTDGLVKVSFALTELELILNESETHRKVYMLLKYIFRTNESPNFDDVFTSFVLKNLLFQHSVSCRGEGLGRCLLKILRDLKHKMGPKGREMPVIPHIFSTEHNLLLDEDDDEPGDCKEERKELSTVIKKLKKVRDGVPMSDSVQI